VIGLLLAADCPSQDKAPPPPKEEQEYAKVELKGQLSVMPPGGCPVIYVQNDKYELDLRQQKDLQGEALRKLDGEIVIVTGTLQLPTKYDRARVLVSSLRLVKER
jgi:hypothetical protein